MIGRSAVYLLYNFLITILSPFWVPWMLWRTWRRKEQPNWQERTGNLPLEGKNAPNRIWFHAVSVGEVIAATPLLKALRSHLPGYQIVLSVTTSSGHQTAEGLPTGTYDTLVYFPIDVARFQLIAMQRVRPKVVVIMETELWYNFLWAAKVFEAKTFLVNGRISDRSYPRSIKFGFFYQALLGFLDEALMQTTLDETRIKSLGAVKTMVLGSSKFDQAIDGLDADSGELRAKYGIPPHATVIVIGSTRGEFEEKFVIDALKEVWNSNLWVVHAPRHIEDVPKLLNTAKERIGESNLLSDEVRTHYQVVDSYGLLSSLYAMADLAIVGGGFAKLGGQNLIQPLAHGKPVLHGPYMSNFRDPATLADRTGAGLSCATSEELANQLRRLIDHPEIREQMSKAAITLVAENVGASERYASEIAKTLNEV